MISPKYLNNYSIIQMLIIIEGNQSIKLNASLEHGLVDYEIITVYFVLA